MKVGAGIAWLLCAGAAWAQTNDKAQANGRDNGWEDAWVAHCRAVYTTTSKTAGMVLQIGDSITHSNPYGQWPRAGAGKTAEDSAVLAWCKAEQGFPGSPTATDKNGFYLCAVDVAGRSLTAAGGATAGEYRTGSGNGGNDMPATTETAAAQGYVLNGDAVTGYTNNLHATTVAAAFADAQFAVVMLGTNDAGAGRPVADFTADLTAIVDVLEGRRIVVVLSTIPPRAAGDVTPYNAAIRSFAASRGLPLIDYYAEILDRRPGDTWKNTLISGDGVHPTSVNSAADPYTPGGNPAAHQTGTNATNDGYLLRGWLTVQKLKEVRSYVADGVDPAVTPPVSSPPASSPPAGSTVASSSDNDNGDHCGCGAARPGAWPWAAAGLVLLPFLRRRR
jgi:MYXO-CTERM domain-containing protein